MKQTSLRVLAVLLVLVIGLAGVALYFGIVSAEESSKVNALQIVSIDGSRIVNYDALAAYLERYTIPGQTIHLGIIRSSSYSEVQATLGGC
jgi:hypothetical protein